MAALCVPSKFFPVVFGAEILNTEANIITNITASIPAISRMTQPAIEVEDGSFCNVAVTYTHRG